MARSNARENGGGSAATGRARGAGASGAPHRPRLPYGATLPAQLAFVVQFANGGALGRRRFTGRVEHLSTGEVAVFSSLKGLLAFLERGRGA